MFMGTVQKPSIRSYSTWDQQVATPTFGCYFLRYVLKNLQTSFLSTTPTRLHIFIYCLLDDNVPSCNNKCGTYFGSKCRQCATCLSTIYIPLNTAPALCYGLRFKNPSTEGSFITVDWPLSLHTNVQMCVYAYNLQQHL
jgi:hypothetical protein